MVGITAAEIIWVVIIVLTASVCAVMLGRKEKKMLENLEERAIRFGEECYIEGIIPIEKVKRLAAFYLMKESPEAIEKKEARIRIEERLEQSIQKPHDKAK